MYIVQKCTKCLHIKTCASELQGQRGSSKQCLDRLDNHTIKTHSNELHDQVK